MKALVYTDVEELTYRDEKDPIEKNGEAYAVQICTHITDTMREESLHLF